MEVIDYRNPILKTVSKPFDFTAPPFNPIDFSHELVKFMYDMNTINLAAIQVGIDYRIFAMRGFPENFVCFNPRVVQPSVETVLLEETSLTYPKLFVKIRRPSHCRVRFAMPNGDVKTETFTGMTARIFQQSMDFLDGKLYYASANPIHREQALRKWKRIIE